MANVIGYRGQPVWSNVFTSNPLQSVPASTVVRLYDYEVEAALAASGYGAWDNLTLGEKRQVARIALAWRTDDESFLQLQALEANDPRFNQFEIIFT